MVPSKTTEIALLQYCVYKPLIKVISGVVNRVLPFWQEDIDVRGLRDYSQSMAQRVGNLVAKQPELAPTLQQLFSQVNS